MSKIVALLLSLYIASFLYLEIPFVKSLPAGIWFQVGAFAVAVVLIFIVLQAKISIGEGQPLMGALLLVGVLGVLGVILTHLIPLPYLTHLPYRLDLLFASPVATTLWFVVPLILLAF